MATSKKPEFKCDYIGRHAKIVVKFHFPKPPKNLKIPSSFICADNLECPISYIDENGKITENYEKCLFNENFKRSTISE